MSGIAQPSCAGSREEGHSEESAPRRRGRGANLCANMEDVKVQREEEEGAGTRERSSSVMPHTMSPEAYTSDMREVPPTFALGISKLQELPAPTMDDPPQDDGSDVVWFCAGNPSVQQFEGHLRIAVNTPDSEAAQKRGRQLCVLAVPRCNFLLPPSSCRCHLHAPSHICK